MKIATSGPDTCAAPARGTLYVIFHGLFCFFDQGGDEILVRTPDLNHAHNRNFEHVISAGNWLGEIQVSPGILYRLKGVDLGPAHFSPATTMIINGGRPANNPKEMYAEFRFPRPKLITPAQIIPIPDLAAFFEGADFDRIAGTTVLSGIQIFTYDFANQNKLALDYHPWRANGMGFNGKYVLHMFAQPDRRTFPGVPPGGHFIHAFDHAIQMFESIDLRVRQPLPVPAQLPGSPIPDIMPDELEDLSLRTRRMAILGSLKRRGLPLEEAWDTDPFIDSSDTERCTHSVGAGAGPGA